MDAGWISMAFHEFSVDFHGFPRILHGFLGFRGICMDFVDFEESAWISWMFMNLVWMSMGFHGLCTQRGPGGERGKN